MISVPQTAEIIINRSRFLSEAMSKGLLNHSAVARYIKPEIEEMLQKKVGTAAIVMALKRLRLSQKPGHKYKSIASKTPDITVHSELVFIYFKYTPLLAKYTYELCASNKETYFFTYTQNANEIILLLQTELYRQLHPLIKGKQIIKKINNLCAVTIQLMQFKLQTPDVFYFFLKSLAWEDINVLEIFGTSKSVTLVLEEKEINHAFIVLKSLFTQH